MKKWLKFKSNITILVVTLLSSRLPNFLGSYPSYLGFLQLLAVRAIIWFYLLQIGTQKNKLPK